MSLLHNVFGLSWMTTAEESFFTYEDGTTWESYAHPEFGPIFEYPDPATMPKEVRAIRGDNLACYYEYVGTDGDVDEAAGAAMADDQFEELKEEIAEKILLCDQIPPLENGRVDVEGYLNGSIARYSCLEEYELGGSSTRTCTQTEDDTVGWSEEEPICNWTCGLCTQEVEYRLSHDPSDCTKYFLCTMGTRIPLVCPPGEAFNREYLVCEKDYLCNDPPGC